jgi:nucleotide-binding universal stress UspA family protein
MPSAEIVSSWQDSTRAYVAVVVDEAGPRGRVEYLASVPIEHLAGKSAAQRKALLAAAAKAARDAQLPAAPTDLGLSGAVTL